MPGIRLAIASEYPIIRTALGTLLHGVQGFDVVAEVGLSNFIKPRDRRCEVFVIELDSGGPVGLERLGALMRVIHPATVAVLSSSRDASFVRSLFEVGIEAYVLKSSSISELFEAIRLAHRGRRYLDPRLGDSIPNPLARHRKPNGRVHASLSGRESEVVREVARGLTSKAIARKLGVSQKTVQTYRARIYEKLSLHTRTEVVQYAIGQGMLQWEETAF
jgi:DNA-binding NarL/FixJ family response regulator